MRFDDEVNTLARALGRVLADGPATKRLRGVEPPVAMIARDAVVGELRSLAGVLLVDADRRLAATDPLHLGLTQLHRALTALPTASQDGFSLTEALAVETTAYCQRWQFAARAAVQLEIYHDVVAGLHATGTAQSLAELAANVDLLDADLVRALPSGPSADFSEHVAHAHIGLAVTRVQRATQSSMSEGPGRPFLPRVLPVRGLDAVPGAMRHLAVLVERRGPEITAQEFRAVTRAVLEGASLAAKQSPDRLRALPPLQRLLAARLATMTKPSRRVLNLSAEIRHATGSARLDEPLEVPNWVAAARSAMVAMASSLDQAAAEGRLLTPSNELRLLVDPGHLWVRSPEQVPEAVASHISDALLAMKGFDSENASFATPSRGTRHTGSTPAEGCLTR